MIEHGRARWVTVWQKVRAPSAIFVAAVFLRAWYVLCARSSPCFDHPMTEAANYLGWAAALRSGSGLQLPFDEGPLYPLLLAALGGGAERIVWLQVLLGGATAVVMGGVVGCVTQDRRAGAIGGALIAAYGPLILHASEVGPATVFITLLAVAMLVTLTATSPVVRRPRVWLAGTSLVWGLALACRSEAILALPFVGLFVLKRTGRRRAAGAALFVSLGYMTAMTAATWIDTGHAVPLTVGAGLNFWAGIHPDADGILPFPSARQVAEQDLIHRQAGDDVTKEDRLYVAASLHFIRQAPFAATARIFKKGLLALQPDELPNTISIEWQRAQSRLFAIWPIFPFDLGLLWALAVLAFPVVPGIRSSWLLLAGVGLVGLAAPMLAQSCGRFRLPMILPVVVLAASGARRLTLRSEGRDLRTQIPQWALAAAVYVLPRLDPFGLRAYFIPELEVNAAICERAAGHIAEAHARLERALAVRADDATAWLELAKTLDREGDPRAASEALSKARRLARDAQ
jgi:hypothetical protein